MAEPEEYTITVDALQCGILFALIISANETARRALGSVYNQLVTIKKRAEEEAGVTKEILPGGLIKSTDKDGTVIIRPPFPYEIEGN